MRIQTAKGLSFLSDEKQIALRTILEQTKVGFSLMIFFAKATATFFVGITYQVIKSNTTSVKENHYK
jgi:hypothetical protein